MVGTSTLPDGLDPAKLFETEGADAITAAIENRSSLGDAMIDGGATLLAGSDRAAAEIAGEVRNSWHGYLTEAGLRADGR